MLAHDRSRFAFVFARKLLTPVRPIFFPGIEFNFGFVRFGTGSFTDLIGYVNYIYRKYV